MRNNTSLSIIAFPAGSAIHVWTVGSLAEDRISCSVHTSESEGDCEAVSRFEFAESGTAQEDTALNSLLTAASTRAEYHEVRKYIENSACRMSLMQLAEHNVNDLHGYQVRTPRLAQATSRVPPRC
jgi:hypothetical protein